MSDMLDADEQRQLLDELQALRSMLEAGQSDGGATPIEPPLLSDIVTVEAPSPAGGLPPGSPPATGSALSDAPDTDLLGPDVPCVEDAPPAEDALDPQFGLDDPDWNQFVDQVFAEHQDLAADHTAPGKREGGSARDLEQSRDAQLLEELTRKLDARLAKLRQTLLLEIKDMLQRRGRLR